MKPQLELVQVRDDQSFKIWAHGYPYRTVRWHFHPEYELHLVTATRGNRYVGNDIGAFSPGDLVLVGPNLPHNWISDVPEGETVSERCLVLQFTESFIRACMSNFPEFRFIEPLLTDAFRGVLFPACVAGRAAPLLRALLGAHEARRLALFMDVVDIIGHAEERTLLASVGFQPNPSAYLSSAMNLVLQHIGGNFTGNLSEAELAAIGGQSVSAFSRSFRRHTGMAFVQYVNALRIELACQHLSECDRSITDICYEIGFNNVSNFNRQFLAVKGMPPSKFRKMRHATPRLSPTA